MPRTIQAALLLMLSLALVGCGGDSHESLAEEGIGILNKMTDSLESVDDQASAEQAAKEIEALAEDFRSVGERIEALGEPDAETTRRVEEKFGPLAEAGTDRFEVEMRRIMELDPALGDVIAESLQKFGEAVQDARPSWQ